MEDEIGRTVDGGGGVDMSKWRERDLARARQLVRRAYLTVSIGWITSFGFLIEALMSWGKADRPDVYDFLSPLWMTVLVGVLMISLTATSYLLSRALLVSGGIRKREGE